MNVDFKVASINDICKIIDLCNECFNEDTDYEYAKKIFMESENDCNQIYLAGYIGDLLVAHAKITVIPTMYNDMGTYSILNHICVKASHRRNNIGTKLLDECKRISLDRNCKSIKLWSNNYRDDAHGCYLNYGYKKIDASFFALDIE